MYLYFFVAFIFGVVSSLIAYTKGRNSLGWLIAGLFIGPFALIVATLPPVAREGYYIACPLCAEVIKEDAKVCRYCGRDVETA